MIKKILLTAVLFLSTALAVHAQIPRLYVAAGPPAGGCSLRSLYVDTTNHAFSFCDNGTWRTLDATGAAAFDDLIGGTNQNEALVVGNGSTLAPTGTGTITANKMSGITAGSIPFGGSSNTLFQDNTNIFWDNTNKRFSVGPRSGFAVLAPGDAVISATGIDLPVGTDVGVGGTIESNGTHNLISVFGQVASTHTSGTRARTFALEGDAYHTGAGGTVTDLNGVVGYAETDAGTVTNMASIHAFGVDKEGGTVTNSWGLKVDDQSGSATNVWSAQFGLGLFEVGDLFALDKRTASIGTAVASYFDNSALTAARTVTLPNANSTTVQPDTGASNNFLTAISASGVISKAQPSFSNISGTATAGQMPSGVNPVLTGTTGSIGGGLLTVGTCTSGTASVTGARTTMAVAATPGTYPGDGNYWVAYVSSNDVVTVKVCATATLTPNASTYIVRVIQ